MARITREQTDVDVVLDLALLSEVDAYKRLEQNLKRLGLEREMNEDGNAKHYSWSLQINNRIKIVLDLLCDPVDGDGGVEGFRKDGPVSYTQFLAGPGQREQILRMQRDAQNVAETFLARFDELAGGPSQQGGEG